MKRVNVLQIVLELTVILGFIVLGVTILTYLLQRVAVDRIVIGLVTAAVGVFGLTEFFTLKYSARRKSIPNLIVALLSLALGIVFLFVRFNSNQLCIIWGTGLIVFAVGRIITSVMNLLRQPLLSIVRIIVNIIAIIFAIFLIVNKVNFLNNYLTAQGIFFLVEAGTLLIEFIIHRYQN